MALSNANTGIATILESKIDVQNFKIRDSNYSTKSNRLQKQHLGGSGEINMIVLLVLLVSILHPYIHASHVDTLTSHNFSFTADVTMVVFYAPWCSYSKSFMPIFNELSLQLHEENKHSKKNISLAKVNCVEEPNLYYQEKIEGKGFPTLKVYLKGSSGDGLFYSLERTNDLIYNYIKKIRDFSNLIDIDEAFYGLTFDDKINNFESNYLTKMKPIAVYNVIDKKNRTNVNNIEYACIKLDLYCGIINSNSDSLLLIRNFINEVKTISVPTEYLLSANDLYDWIQDHAYPLVVEFKAENQEHIFSRRKGFNVHVIIALIALGQNDEDVINSLWDMARKYKGRCIFITIDTSSTDEYTQTIMSELSIEPNSRSIKIVHSNQDKIDFYESDDSSDSFIMLENFIDNYFAKKIKPTKTRLTQD